jgi:hypothetical protein
MHTKLRNFLIRNLPLIYWKFLIGTPIPQYPEHQAVGEIWKTKLPTARTAALSLLISLKTTPLFV